MMKRGLPITVGCQIRSKWIKFFIHILILSLTLFFCPLCTSFDTIILKCLFFYRTNSCFSIEFSLDSFYSIECILKYTSVKISLIPILDFQLQTAKLRQIKIINTLIFLWISKQIWFFFFSSPMKFGFIEWQK